MKYLIKLINSKYKIKFFLFPDHFLGSLERKDSLLLSSEFYIDPDMVLKLDSNWTCFNDYLNQVVSKYKKRIRKVFRDSSSLIIEKIDPQNIVKLVPSLQKLYLNVHHKSSFSGPSIEFKNLYRFCLLFKN